MSTCLSVSNHGWTYWTEADQKIAKNHVRKNVRKKGCHFMTSPIEAKIVGRTLRYGKPYLLWTRVFAVSCIILPLVGKVASVPCGRVWKWGILPFYHMFSRFFWWSGGFGGNICMTHVWRVSYVHIVNKRILIYCKKELYWKKIMMHPQRLSKSFQ